MDSPEFSGGGSGGCVNVLALTTLRGGGSRANGVCPSEFLLVVEEMASTYTAAATLDVGGGKEVNGGGNVATTKLAAERK